MSDLVLILTRRTLRPSKSTFPPRRAASTASSNLIPVGLPSSVMRGSLPIGSARGTVTRGCELRHYGVLGSSPCASYGGIMPADEEVGQPEKRVGKKEERHLRTSTRRCSTTRSIQRNSPPTSAAHYSPPT